MISQDHKYFMPEAVADHDNQVPLLMFKVDKEAEVKEAQEVGYVRLALMA
tara:strand:- start:27 stop:176 length:150 start_codon:yes stop_codon:yes gene_type:complete